MTLVQCTTGPMGVSPVLPGLVLPIDMNKDLQPVARFVQANWGIAVPKNSPYKTLAELIADAKKKPGTLNYGHSGVGSLQHLAAEWLAVKAGIKMQGIAYRGTGPAVLELMGGRLDLVVTSLGDFSGQAKAGQLRILTLIDDIGSPQFPDAPQASATVPGYAVTGWVGVCGPRGLPRVGHPLVGEGDGGGAQRSRPAEAPARFRPDAGLSKAPRRSPGRSRPSRRAGRP